MIDSAHQPPDVADLLGPILNAHVVPHSWWVPFLIIILPTILLVLVRTGQWENFANRQKVTSRIILFMLMLGLLIPLNFIREWAFEAFPAEMAVESPNLTATAIKIGLYGLYVQYAVANQLPADQQPLVRCIAGIAFREGHTYQDVCGNNAGCYEHIPLMTRDVLIAKIKQYQSDPTLNKACKNVDVSKL